VGAAPHPAAVQPARKRALCRIGSSARSVIDDARLQCPPESSSRRSHNLEKNLRLALRGGKRYDFTDPEDNADHLFVFHRDVEKARERLKKGDRPAQNQ
jgi:hypothetical protein